jgi:hypothetical protein
MAGARLTLETARRMVASIRTEAFSPMAGSIPTVDLRQTAA